MTFPTRNTRMTDKPQLTNHNVTSYFIVMRKTTFEVQLREGGGDHWHLLLLSGVNRSRSRTNVRRPMLSPDTTTYTNAAKMLVIQILRTKIYIQLVHGYLT
jgi:hypothetical protein